MSLTLFFYMLVIDCSFTTLSRVVNVDGRFQYYIKDICFHFGSSDRLLSVTKPLVDWKMIKLAVLLVCVAISRAEPQRQNVYLPHESVGPYNYVRVIQQPFLRPVNRVPIVVTNRLPSPSYPTFVRLPALPDRRQFRLPLGGYFIIPASALHGQQQESSILAAQRLFRPIGLPTAPQVRPAVAAGPEDDKCQDDSSANLQSTEETEEQN